MGAWRFRLSLAAPGQVASGFLGEPSGLGGFVVPCHVQPFRHGQQAGPVLGAMGCQQGPLDPLLAQFQL